jgi:release factor glutamine methyltransferase
VYFEARKRLKDSGIEAYSLEAKLLVCKASGKSKEEFMRDCRLYIPEDSAYERQVNALVQRRIAGEPVAYITGEWEFYGLPMTVNPDVLIPRADTEVLVDAALAAVKEKPRPLRILDLCTGSGCVGIALGVQLPGSRVVLIDRSVKALHICRQNIFINKMTRNITCIDGDVLAPPPLLIGTFDLIVCNPPYIPTGEIDQLDHSVKDYEPTSALDGGADGLDFYRAITALWKTVLKENGYLAYECGVGQAEQVCEILRVNGFEDIQVTKDTLKIDRVVVGRQPVAAENGGDKNGK